MRDDGARKSQSQSQSQSLSEVERGAEAEAAGVDRWEGEVDGVPSALHFIYDRPRSLQFWAAGEVDDVESLWYRMANTALLLYTKDSRSVRASVALYASVVDRAMHGPFLRALALLPPQGARGREEVDGQGGNDWTSAAVPTGAVSRLVTVGAGRGKKSFWVSEPPPALLTQVKMLGLLVWMVIKRLQVEGEFGKKVSQDLYDRMWDECAERLKYEGVTSGLAQIKNQMCSEWYDTALTFDAAVAQPDPRDALLTAVWNSLYSDPARPVDIEHVLAGSAEEAGPLPGVDGERIRGAHLLATYVHREISSLALTAGDALLSGNIRFSGTSHRPPDIMLLRGARQPKRVHVESDGWTNPYYRPGPEVPAT